MHAIPNVFLAACVMGLVAASPRPRVEEYERRAPKTSFVKGRAAAADTPDPKQLMPCPYPKVDQKDLNNLKATYDAILHYAESMDDVDQQIATLDSKDPEYPMVQLEHSSYVQSVSCDDTSASVTFSTKEAFDAASADWKSHEEFIIISTDPACGPEHDPSKRDYMLASSAEADPKTMTIKTGVEFVEWKAAFGEQANIHGEIGTYTSKTGRRKRDVEGSTEFDWDVFPTTPLGAAFAGQSGFGLFSNANGEVACIDCGTKGNVKVTGKFDFSLFKGVETASVTVEGSVSASIHLGVNLKAVETIPIANKRLATVPLSPLTIAGIVTVGPLITVDAGANIDLVAQGTVVVGAALDWPALRVTGDFAKETGDSSGLDPNITPRADINSSISATFKLDAPVGVGVGLDIANGLFDKSLTLTASPGFRVSATVDDDPKCEGVAVNAGLGIPIGLDVFEITTVPLPSFTTALFETCFPLDPAITSLLPDLPGPVSPPATLEGEAPPPTDAPAPPPTPAPTPEPVGEDLPPAAPAPTPAPEVQPPPPARK